MPRQPTIPDLRDSNRTVVPSFKPTDTFIPMSNHTVIHKPPPKEVTKMTLRRLRRNDDELSDALAGIDQEEMRSILYLILTLVSAYMSGGGWEGVLGILLRYLEPNEEEDSEEDE